MKKPYFAYRSFWPQLEAKRQFAELGVKQFCVFSVHSANSMGEPYCLNDPTWKWYDVYDFAPFDREVDEILAIAPDARILCLVDLNSPLWLARQQSVDSFPQLTCAECDDGWRLETGKYLDAFMGHAEERYGDVIDCFVLMCGFTDEWMDNSCGCASEGKFRRYRQWCRDRGLPVPEGLPSSIYSNTSLDCEEAVQYWRFHGEFNVDTILHFAAKTRNHLRPGQEIGVFYGHVLELGAISRQRSHLDYERLQQSPLIDFVISPGDYEDRAMGGGSGFMSPNGTIHLNGKGCLYEIDHATHTGNLSPSPYASASFISKWKDIAEDVAGIRREFCRTLFHGASLWWFDMWGGFYELPEQLAAIRQCLRIWDRYADRTFEPDAQVALVVDPEGILRLPATGNYLDDYHLFMPALNSLNRLGAPYRVYSMNDLASLPREIRLLVLVAPYAIPAEASGRVAATRCVWCGPHGAAIDGLPGTRIADVRQLTPQLLRSEAESAGVHIYIDEPCPVWAGRNLLSVHVATGGRRVIRLPHPAKYVRELFSGGTADADGQSFSWEFSTPDTALFEISRQ